MASDDKYDRQLRLWEGHGQKLLATANVLMLGTSSAGTETLKNLVLPGVGNIMIVDDYVVGERDLGHDFFVEEASVGQPKAKVVCEFLLEMNPDSKGSFKTVSIQSFIDEQASEISNKQLVIACDVTNSQALKLSAICGAENVPLMIVRQYGMIGYIRLFKAHSEIIQPKMAQFKFKDLRVYNPFDELEAFAAKFDLSTMSEMEHNHVPYAVLQIQALQKWRAEHEGQVPKNFAEKTQFRAMIKGMARWNGVNFDEAIQNVDACFKSDQLPSNVAAVFEQLKNAEKEPARFSSTFWLCAAALQRFYQAEKRLPVSGQVPDMVSTTENYLELQQIYVAKAEKDKAIMHDLVLAVMKERGLDSQGLDQDTFNLFCKNSLLLEVVDMDSIEQELSSPDWEFDVADEYNDPESSTSWLLAIKAFEAVSETLKIEDLGQDESQAATLLEALKKESLSMTSAFAPDKPLEEKYLKEMLRYGRCKLHCISSFLGGVASQEACKLIMSQYIPMKHTFVYDGIHGRGQVFNL